MSKGNTFENDILGLILNATPIANLAIDASSGPLTVLQIALHTGDPGDGGDQTTSECAYTGYGRKTIARDAGSPEWDVADGSAENNVAVDFDECTAGSSTATHFSVGTAGSGAGKILYSGALTASLAISAGITPSFAIGALVITED